MTSKQTEPSEAAPTKEKEEAAKPTRPTPEQLQKLTDGGSYTFNAETGRFNQTRQGTALKDLKRA